MADDIWREGISVRRLSVLVKGFPADAAVWREDRLPPVEERLVQILERQEMWFRALFEAQVGQSKIRVPGEISIPRPGEPEPLKVRPVVTDAAQIARWFSGAM